MLLARKNQPEGYQGKQELHHGTGNVGEGSSATWGWVAINVSRFIRTPLSMDLKLKYLVRSIVISLEAGF